MRHIGRACPKNRTSFELRDLLIFAGQCLQPLTSFLPVLRRKKRQTNQVGGLPTRLGERIKRLWRDFNSVHPKRSMSNLFRPHWTGNLKDPPPPTYSQTFEAFAGRVKVSVIKPTVLSNQDEMAGLAVALKEAADCCDQKPCWPCPPLTKGHWVTRKGWEQTLK